MKGTILKYDVQSKEGVIRGADEQRYPFNMHVWDGETPPFVGGEVDFVLENGVAKEICPLVKASGTRITEKSKPTATLLGIFLGGFGAHKFYMGNWGWGIIYLVTCWLYVPFFIAMAEWIRYVLMSDVEFIEKSRQAQLKGPFGFLW